jgi:hypothetical protein
VEAFLQLLLAEQRQTWELTDASWRRLSQAEGVGIHERLMAGAGTAEAAPPAPGADLTP